MSLKAAKKELERAGFFSKDADYNGALGHAVMRLMEVHLKEGHSGFSNGMAVEVFRKLATGQVLSPITDNPDEWMDVAELNGGATLYQNKRDSAHFSEDGGKTYYHVDDKKVMMVAVKS